MWGLLVGADTAAAAVELTAIGNTGLDSEAVGASAVPNSLQHAFIVGTICAAIVLGTATAQLHDTDKGAAVVAFCSKLHCCCCWCVVARPADALPGDSVGTSRPGGISTRKARYCHNAYQLQHSESRRLHPQCGFCKPSVNICCATGIQ